METQLETLRAGPAIGGLRGNGRLRRSLRSQTGAGASQRRLARKQWYRVLDALKLDAEEINGLQQAGAWAKAQWERLIQWRKTYSPTDLSGLDPDILAGFRRDLGRSPWNRVLQQPGVASSSGPRHQTESKASGEVDNTAATGDIDLLTTVWCWTIVVQDQMAPVYYFATLNVLERAEDRELLAHDMAHLEQKFPYLFKVCHALQPYDEPWRTALILFRERHVVMRLTSDKTSWQSNVPMVLGGVTEFPHTASGDSTNNIQSDKIVENGGTGERKSGDSQSQQQPKGFQLHDLHECSTQAEVQQHVWLCRVRWVWPPEALKTGWAQAVKLEATAWPAAEYPAWQDPAVCVHVARYTPTQDLAHTLIRAWSREACEAALSPLPPHQGGKLQYMPERYFDEALMRLAVKMDPDNFPFVPRRFKTRDFIDHVVQCNGRIIKHCTPKQQTEARCWNAVAQQPANIQYVLKPNRELLEWAVQREPETILLVIKAQPKKVITPGLIQLALITAAFNAPESLRPILEACFAEFPGAEWLTLELWDIVLRADPQCIKAISPTHAHYKDMCWVALKASCDTIDDIHHPTHAMIEFASGGDGGTGGKNRSSQAQRP